jgi:hypothetical protein
VGAIATVYVDQGPEEARRLLELLFDWADGAIGIDVSRADDVVEVTFPDSDTASAERYIEQVLSDRNPRWREYLGVAFASTG